MRSVEGGNGERGGKATAVRWVERLRRAMEDDKRRAACAKGVGAANVREALLLVASEGLGLMVWT